MYVGQNYIEVYKSRNIKNIDIINLIQKIKNSNCKYFAINNNNKIYTSSINVLLNYPEFQNISQFQKILPALDKSYLSDYFNQYFSHELDQILIGEENADKILSECSIISSMRIMIIKPLILVSMKVRL